MEKISSFFVLHFRTSSASPNSGFHINVKAEGTRSPYHRVKYLELAPTRTDESTPASSTREFKYPQPPASKYGNNERTFVIVKPASRQGKLKFELKSVNTEKYLDWMEVYTVNSKPVRHLGFEAEAGEPFIIYFESDESYTRSGFHFSYSEQRIPGVERRLIPFAGKMEVDQNRNPVPYQLSIRLNGSHVCGGVILDKKTALSAASCFTSQNISEYTVVPGETNLNEIDTAKQILQIEKLFKHPNFTNVLGGNDIAVIHIQGEFNFNDRLHNVWISSQSSPNFQDVTGVTTGWSRNKTGGAISPVLQSFELEFMDREKCESKGHVLPPSTFCGYNNFSNSCGGDAGGPLVIKNHEHTGYSTKDLLVGISSFGPADCEELDQPNGFTNVSHFYEWIAKVRSDSLCSSSQFQCFNGECIDEKLKCNQIFDCADGSDEQICPPPTQSPYETVSCGGFIRLVDEYEIVYKVPENLRGQKSVCVWVIQAETSEMQVKLLQNPQAQFQPEDSTLFAIHGFYSDGFDYKNLYEYSRFDKDATFYGTFFVLHFRTNSSAPTCGFHIHLKDKREDGTQWAGKYLELTSTQTPTDGAAQEFKYPLPPASEYRSDEETLIVVKPETHGGKLKLDLKSVDTQKYKDWVNILSVKSEPTSEFRFSGQGSWSNKTFEAEEGEPFIIYFQSDYAVMGAGFKFTYSE